jgi:hypothetical protein
MAPAERLGPWNGRLVGMPCGALFYSGCAPSCDVEKSEGKGRGPDCEQHVVRSTGSAAGNGLAVHGGVADWQGKT